MVADRRARDTWPPGAPMSPRPESRYTWQASPPPADAWPPRQPVHEVGTPVPAKKKRRPDASRWHWLLLIPILLPLLPPLYNRMEPRLLGLPFFYWCQLAFAGVAALTVAIVHVATKERR